MRGATGDLSSVSRADPQSGHGPAVPGQSHSGEPRLGTAARVVLSAAEPVHRRGDQRAELHRQRARRLHGRRLRRPRRLSCRPGAEGVRAPDVEERRRHEPVRQRLEHDAGRSVQADRGAPDRRRAQLGPRQLLNETARRLVEHRREGQLHQRVAGRRSGGRSRARRPARRRR